jgi:hypothetical protein
MAVKYVGMGSTPDRGMRELQENIRILQDEVTRLAGLVGAQSSLSVTKPDRGNNFTARDLERLRFEYDRHDHPTTPDLDYVTVSYDADDEEFTVTVTNLPVYNINSVDTPQESVLLSQTFVIDKPAAVSTFTLICDKGRLYADYDATLFWTGTSVTSDAATQLSYSTGQPLGTLVAEMTFTALGTHSISAQVDERVLINEDLNGPLLTVSTTGLTINVANTHDRAGFTNSFAYTAPFDDDIIIGFQNSTGRCYLDAHANRGSYTNVLLMGHVKISSANKVEQVYVRMNSLSIVDFLVGPTGSFTTVDGKTVSVNKGRIYQIV